MIPSVEVWTDLESLDQTDVLQAHSDVLVGIVRFGLRRGALSSTFQYDPKYLRGLSMTRDKVGFANGQRDIGAYLLGEEDDGLYIRDIMRGGIGNDDERIPRNMAE